MASRTLFDAFAAAQATNRLAVRNVTQVTEETLLEALRNSVTDRDQIMQRRVRFLDDETFGAKTLFDADLGYQFTKNMQLVIGADNLLNTFPDKNTKADNISSGRFVYNRNVSQFGLNGGFYYGKLQLTFF